MSRRPVAPLAALVALAVSVAVLVGCSRSDDELERPTARTTTTVPAPSPSDTSVRIPATVPVGSAGLDARDPVWAQGSTIKITGRPFDLSPRRVDALVQAPGGVYFLDGDELWFTDLAVVRAAGLTGGTGLAVAADGHAIVVTTSAGRRAFDTRTGRPVDPRTVRVATGAQRLGTRSQVALRPERSDVSASSGPVPARLGPGGRYGVADVEGGPLVAFDAATDTRVPLRGAVAQEFELVRWTGATTFYGLAIAQGRPTSVLGCDLAAGSCGSWGAVDPGEPLVLESGS